MSHPPVRIATPALLFAIGSLVTGSISAAEGPQAIQADSLVFVLPVIGSTPGQFGSFFKTSIQLYNPNSSGFTFRAVFHPAGVSGSPSDPSKTVTIPAGATVYYEDFLPFMGVPTGLGSLDIFLPVGEHRPAAATTRVYNDAGAAGTTGFTESAEEVNLAFGPGDTVRLICSPNPSIYRFNVGVRSLGNGFSFTATLRSGSGAYITTLNKDYDPDFFQQVSLESFMQLGAPLTGGESLTMQITSGSGIIYGATVDNRTQDPSMGIAQAD